MEESLEARITRAKQLLATARNASMATVNADGTPHNTPFFFIRDNASLEYIYWSSRPDSLHCQNAERTGRIFVVLYESNTGGGLYIKADDAHQLSGNELERALTIHNAMRAREYKAPIPLSYFSDQHPQRMYAAKATNFYVNVSERDGDGFVIRDSRHEIDLKSLL